MNSTLATHVGSLAESLHDLRRRFRQAARYEVARVIAEALRDAATMIVCGPAPMPAMPRSPSSTWDDPWNDPLEDPWHNPGFGAVVDADDHSQRPLLCLSPAVLAGVGAARWSYMRSRQIGPAVLIGLVVTLAATIGGPSVQSLLRAWAVVNDLLRETSSEDGL